VTKNHSSKRRIEERRREKKNAVGDGENHKKFERRKENIRERIFSNPRRRMRKDKIGSGGGKGPEQTRDTRRITRPERKSEKVKKKSPGIKLKRKGGYGGSGKISRDSRGDVKRLRV